MGVSASKKIAIRSHAHIADDVWVDEGSVVVVLELFAAYAGPMGLVSVAFRGERRGAGVRGALANAPDGWLAAHG